MQTYHTIVNYLSIHWPAILSLVGGGAGVSVALECILRKLKINSKQLAFTLLHLFTALTTIATLYLANIKGKDGLPIYGALVIFAEIWNRFAVSPFYNKIVVPYLEYQNTKQAKLPVSTPVIETPVETEPNPFA